MATLKRSGGGGDDSPPFHKPRVIGGLLILALVVLLYVMDFASPEFSVDAIQLGLLLGSALLLLGIEAGRRLLGGGGS